MRTIASIVLTLLVITSFAGIQEISESSIRFDIKNAGISVEGSFTGLTGSIDFDPANYTKAKVELNLPSTTINTGIASRDNHLKKAEYFDVAKFPNITMKSKFFGKGSEDGAFRGYFVLTLKGVSKDITLPFTCIKEGNNYRIKGDFTINRRDFGIGGKSLIMGDEVNIHINLLLASISKSTKSGSQLPINPEEFPSNNSLTWIYTKP